MSRRIRALIAAIPMVTIGLLTATLCAVGYLASVVSSLFITLAKMAVAEMERLGRWAERGHS